MGTSFYWETASTDTTAILYHSKGSFATLSIYNGGPNLAVVRLEGGKEVHLPSKCTGVFQGKEIYVSNIDGKYSHGFCEVLEIGRVSPA